MLNHRDVGDFWKKTSRKSSNINILIFLFSNTKSRKFWNHIFRFSDDIILCLTVFDFSIF